MSGFRVSSGMRRGKTGRLLAPGRLCPSGQRREAGVWAPSSGVAWSLAVSQQRGLPSPCSLAQSVLCLRSCYRDGDNASWSQDRIRSQSYVEQLTESDPQWGRRGHGRTKERGPRLGLEEEETVLQPLPSPPLLLTFGSQISSPLPEFWPPQLWDLVTTPSRFSAGL